MLRINFLGGTIPWNWADLRFGDGSGLEVGTGSGFTQVKLTFPSLHWPAVWLRSGRSGPNLLSSKMVQHLGLLDCGGSKRIRWVQWKLLRWWWWPPLSEGWSCGLLSGLKLKGVRIGWLCVGAWCGVVCVCVWGVCFLPHMMEWWIYPTWGHFKIRFSF